MTSCTGFDLSGFTECDGWEWWAGFVGEEDCDVGEEECFFGGFCDDFSSLIGFDDDSTMESMDEDCV